MKNELVSKHIEMIENEIEKFRGILNMPLRSNTWARDIVADVSDKPHYSEFSDYEITNFSSGKTHMENKQSKNQMVGADIRISQEDMIASDSLSLSPKIEELINMSIRLNYDMILQQNIYTGLSAIENSCGLINNPEIDIIDSSIGSWMNKHGDQILDDINEAINTVWNNCYNDRDSVPNHILLPTQLFVYINRTMMSDDSMYIIRYLEENNIAKKDYNVDLKIYPCRQLNGMSRMVVYRNDKKFIRFDINIPLRALPTAFDKDKEMYITPFESMIGAVKFIYPETILYVDGI